MKKPCKTSIGSFMKIRDTNLLLTYLLTYLLIGVSVMGTTAACDVKYSCEFSQADEFCLMTISLSFGLESKIANIYLH